MKGQEKEEKKGKEENGRRAERGKKRKGEKGKHRETAKVGLKNKTQSRALGRLPDGKRRSFKQNYYPQLLSLSLNRPRTPVCGL